MAVLIAVEGVLRTETGQPIREGLLLFRSLVESHRIILLLDDLEPALAKQWLILEGITKHAELVEADSAYTGMELRQHQLERARARDSIDFLIDCSPANIAMALSLGVTGLLLSQPKYARPEFRPDLDEGVQPWAAIQQELVRQQHLKVRDERLASPEVVTTD